MGGRAELDKISTAVLWRADPAPHLHTTVELTPMEGVVGEQASRVNVGAGAATCLLGGRQHGQGSDAFPNSCPLLAQVGELVLPLTWAAQ